jgi:hypothetical protein
MGEAAASPSAGSGRFPSLTALRGGHADLLRRHQALEGELPASFVAEIRACLDKAVATGAILDGDEERWDAQTLLNYWTTVLYSAETSHPSARLGSGAPQPTAPPPVLAEFDPEVAAAEVGEANPYRGLQAFDKDDETVFFGRRKVIQDAVARLKDSRFLSVLGISGSGKSSLVRAGILPALEHGAAPGSDRWRIFDKVLPGSNPLGSLAAITRPHDQDADTWHAQEVPRLLSDPQRLVAWLNTVDSPALIVVDQFEELFTLDSPEPERQAFLRHLVAVVQSPGPRHTAIVTMRSEFDTFVARYPDLRELFDRSQIRVPPIDPAGLRQAIERPAGRRGVAFEPGLVADLVQQVLGEPAGLPLLQFTLQKLWERREGRTIKHKAFEELGGSVREVLARSAESTFESFKTPEDRTLSRDIFLRLVQIRPGTEAMSQRACRSALLRLAARDRVNAVLDRWEDAGLLRVTPGRTRDDDLVEVTHEALIRNWPTLVRWIEEKRGRSRKRLAFTAAAEYWHEHRRDRGGLISGSLLAEARTFDELSELESAFVKASEEAEASRAAVLVKAQQDREKEQRERIDTQERAARSLRVGLIVLALFALSLAGTAWWAWNQRDDAREATRRLQVELDRVKNLNEQVTRSSNQIKSLTQPALLEPNKMTQQSPPPSAADPEATPRRLMKLWDVGRTLRISFLDGEPLVRKKVASVAQRWTRHANLNFDFGSHREPDVRVSFKQPGSWGCQGTECLEFPADNPNVNFGWLNKSTSDEEYSRMVLHEFGHVLGLIHEQANPNANIPWDKAAVYRFFEGPPNFWTREQVDVNLFQKENLPPGIEYREFDPASVMMLPIPAELTQGKLTVGLNTRLSASDKRLARKLYPGRPDAGTDEAAPETDRVTSY